MIKRRIDELGRVVIPKEMRASLGLECLDQVEITLEDGKVILRPHDEISSLKKQIEKLENQIRTKLLEVLEGAENERKKIY
jgi:transcriptional pleiotropic regulator of transition state genes